MKLQKSKEALQLIFWKFPCREMDALNEKVLESENTLDEIRKVGFIYSFM